MDDHHDFRPQKERGQGGRSSTLPWISFARRATLRCRLVCFNHNNSSNNNNNSSSIKVYCNCIIYGLREMLQNSRLPFLQRKLLFGLTASRHATTAAATATVATSLQLMTMSSSSSSSSSRREHR
jgi:hypothetical protein